MTRRPEQSKLLCIIALIAAVAIADSRPAFVPKDATATARCVAGLGDVYWNPAKLPFGPTYGAYKGQPIFEEFMISQEDLARGRNWQDIRMPIRGYAVDHIDIWFAPHEHDGAPNPTMTSFCFMYRMRYT